MHDIQEVQVFFRLTILQLIFFFFTCFFHLGLHVFLLGVFFPITHTLKVSSVYIHSIMHLGHQSFSDHSFFFTCRL